MGPFRARTAFVTTVAILTIVAAAACSNARAREYELKGQILAIDESRAEVTVKHEDIRGFMPGMTMAFAVKPAGAIAGKKPGDLIRATLVVEEALAYLSEIETTGHAPVTEPLPPPRVSLLEPGDPLPDAVLVDSTGTTRHLSEWRGKALALTFIYTRCPVPNFCPLMDRNFAEVQRAVAEDSSLSSRTHLVSISFDPEYDTPPVLAAHAKRAGADPRLWTFLTGDRNDVEAFGAQLGVSIVPDQASAPEIVHNLRTAVVDTEGRLVKILNGNEWTPGELLDLLRNASGVRK